MAKHLVHDTTILIGAVLLLCISGVQAKEPVFQISNSQFPCNDAETDAGAVMFLRQMGLSFDEVEYRFREQDRAKAAPYIQRAFLYPQVRDDGKSRGDAVQAFKALELLKCEALVPDKQLDPNRHDQMTGRRLE